MSPPIQSATKTRRCTRHPVPGDELWEPRAQPASCSLGFAGRRNGTQLPAGRVLQLRATAPTRVRLRSHPQPAACSSGSEPVPGGWEKIGRVGNLPRVKLRIAFDSRGLRLRNALAARGRRKSVGKVSVPPGACSPRTALVRWSRCGLSPALVHCRDYLGVAASKPPDLSATRGGSGHLVSAQGRRRSCR